MPKTISSETLTVILVLITLVNLAILTMYSLWSQSKIKNLDRMVKKLGGIVSKQILGQGQGKGIETAQQVDPKIKAAQDKREAILRIEEELRKQKADLADNYGDVLVEEPSSNSRNRKEKKTRALEDDF